MDELSPFSPLPPKNESTEHFLLKQIGSIFLKVEKKCQFIGQEIYMRRGRDNGRTKKKIADVVGVKKVKSGKDYNFESYCVEAKTSVSDYKNGFNSGGTYNWIITSPNLLQKEDLPPDIGLIEVDLDNFRWEQRKKFHYLEGITEVKKPKRQRLSNVVGKECLENISKRLTNEQVFKNYWIRPTILEKKKK